MILHFHYIEYQKINQPNLKNLKIIFIKENKREEYWIIKNGKTKINIIIADMIGMVVYTEDGEEFGHLKDVLETGANDVYIIDSEKHGEVLIPAIKQCILNVDIEQGKMVIHLLEGLV